MIKNNRCSKQPQGYWHTVVLGLPLVLLLMSSACVQSVHATFPIPSNETGQLKIRLSSAAERVTVSISDQIIVEDEMTSEVVVTGVPVGVHQVVVRVEGSALKHALHETKKATVKRGETAEVTITTPQPGHYFWLYLGGGLAVGVIVSLFLGI